MKRKGISKKTRFEGADVEDLKDWAKRSRSWTNWRDEMLQWIEDLKSTEGGRT